MRARQFAYSENKTKVYITMKVPILTLLSLRDLAYKPPEMKVVTEFEIFVSAMSTQHRWACPATALHSEVSSDEEGTVGPQRQQHQPLLLEVRVMPML
jgi:hypothetical protein